MSSSQGNLLNKPLVTIITVVYNRVKMISQCIDSVLAQTYGKENIQYIVIDGGSDDGTVDVVRSYQDKGFVDYFISEKDGGIYDAMNKGLAKAQGEFIVFLNSDDWYEPYSVEESIATVLANGADYCFGNSRVYYPDSRKVSHIWVGDIENVFFGCPYSHQTFFCKKSIYDAVGMYDTQFKYGADYDFMFRLYERRYKYVHVNKIIVNASAGGIAWDPDVFGPENLIVETHHLPFILAELRNCKQQLKINHGLSHESFDLSGGIKIRLLGLLKKICTAVR